MVENPSPTEHKAEAAAAHVKEKASDINAIREMRDSRDGHNPAGGVDSRHSVDLERTYKEFPRDAKGTASGSEQGWLLLPIDGFSPLMSPCILVTALECTDASSRDIVVCLWRTVSFRLITSIQISPN